MSIQVLTQVYDEVRRLAIAGSSLAPGDFRLKKLIPPLEAAGKKSPVFGKVAQSAQRLVESKEKEAADALLELSTLVSSILYTQGETGASGRAKAIETVDLGPPVTGTSSRVLKPLIEALTTTGSGRLELIRDAHQRGAFRDMRLVNPTLEAIDDAYGEIGDLIADQVLPLYGKTIYPELKAHFDIKGRGGHVRRLRLMHKLDPDATRPLVEEALESGSKEMKIAAMGCIGNAKDALPYLLEQVKAKAKDVRAAALGGLAGFKTDDAVDALIAALGGKDMALAVEPAAKNPSPRLLKHVLGESEKWLEEALTVKAKTKRIAALGRLHSWLGCLRNRTDKSSVAFLKRLFDQREELYKIKSGRSLGGSQIVWTATDLLVSTGSKPVLKELALSHAGHPSEILQSCFVAAAITLPAKKVYDEYSPYLLDKPTDKKSARDMGDRREAITEGVSEVAGRGFHPSHYYYDDQFSRIPKTVKLDPRWLDAAITADHSELVNCLLRPKHKRLNEYLTENLEACLKKRDAYWQASHTLDAMIKVEHPDTTELFLKFFNKELASMKRARYYSYWWIAQLIPRLPKDAVEPLEALIPKLPDKAADNLVPQIAELKSKHQGSKSKK